MSLVEAPVMVATNATPGLRSISVQANGYTAWANGFVEVLPPFPDFNFDGLDDRWQRKYWSPFTRPEAAPNADPDGDGFVNRREFVMGSDPTDPNSVKYRILSVKLNAGGTVITWESAPARRYQVWSRPDAASGGAAGWLAVGSPVTAPGETASSTDTRPATGIRFYLVGNAP
jgi:hypothetical protein